MSHQANDAAAQSPTTHELPPLPSSPDSATASRPPVTVIDLSSPTRPNEPSRQVEGHPVVKRPRLAKHQMSEDEKRLPGSNSSFRPVNTIADVNTTGRGRQVTYSKQHRQSLPPIGQARHRGQLAFLELEKRKVPTTPGGSASSRAEQARIPGGASSAKRKRTQDIIDLSDDNDVRAVAPPSVPYTPAGTSYEVPLSARSSQSNLSVGSGSTTTGVKQTTQLKSEFRITDDLLNSHRKKQRTPGSNRRQGAQQISPLGPDSYSGSIEVHTPRASISAKDDEGSSQLKSARRYIFDDFKQGESARLSHERQQQFSKHDTTVSPHFPNARANESTSDQTADKRQARRNGTELRKQYRPAPSRYIDADSSEDELATSNWKDFAHGRGKVMSKAKQAANSGVKRKIREKEASEGWPLVSARARDYKHQGSVTGGGRAELYLRPDSSGFRVTAFDQTEDEFSTILYIRPQDVNIVDTDHESRIRLRGPRPQNGIQYTFELEFAQASDLQVFIDDHARSLALPGKFFHRDVDTMAKLFSKSLMNNEKLVLSDPVYESMPDADKHIEGESKTSKTPLWNQLRVPTQASKTNGAVNGTFDRENLSRPGRTSTRPTRSTRSSGLGYDLEPSIDTPKVEKYSIDVGLGIPWNKPLEYGRGRQRAVVHFDDLPRLDEEEYMNDSLIDFYMIYLFNKLKVPSDKVYFFNTYFFTQLTKNTGRQSMNYKAVERWTSKIDIFSYDYIVVPINEATHWYLAIICNVSSIDRSPSVEEIDKDLAEAIERSRQDLVNQADTTTDRPQPTESLHLPGNAEHDHIEGNDDDPDLFQEESSLNIVDREDPGTAIESQTTDNQIPSAPHSPAAKIVHAAEIVSNAAEIPKGILSNLIASPERKKGKRKFSQPKKDPSQPIILILDSLGQVRSGTVRALKDWLAAEGEAKRGIEAMIKEKGYYPKATQIPMQNNWTDCGVYLLGYVEKFFQNPDEFKHKLLTGEMSADEDWPELKPGEMRKNMREIIVECAEEQKVARREEKKAKKVCSKAKTSPVPVKEQVKSEHKVFQSELLPSTKPVEDTKEPSSAHTTSVETREANVQPPTELLRPRLASPFSPNRQSAKTPNRSQSPAAVEEPSNLPSVSISANQVVATTPDLRQMPRHKSPEVRIPIKTPQSVASARHGRTSSDRMVHDNEPMQSPRSTFQVSSPTKRPRQDEDDGQLSLPVAKKPHTRSPQQQKSNRIERSSPLVSRSREGSAGQPIQIDDSQEVQSVDFTPTKYQQTGVSPKHNMPLRSTRRPKVLHHTPSVEEIQRPTTHAVQRHDGQGEGRLAGQVQQVELKDADLDRIRTRRSGARSPATPTKKRSPYHKEGTELDLIDADSRDADLMDVETDDVRLDATVRETPEAMRSSPRTKMGGSLGR
ncbi:Nn.00g080930.m01.CDS01 [Neocucurbitaria sp. VM-36]